MLHPVQAAVSNRFGSPKRGKASQGDLKYESRSSGEIMDRPTLGTILHRSKKELVYQILKEAVIDRRWHPGEMRSFIEISNLLKVSRTPVAEACKLLEKEGWVIIRPQVGVEVAPISIGEIIENLKIRGVLEGLAGLEAMNFLEEKDFENLRQLLKLMETTPKKSEFEKFIEWNQVFHRMIYKASRMEQLIRILDQYWDNGKRYRAFYKHLPNILADANRRHSKILNALKTKDRGLVRAELEKDSWDFGQKLSKYFLGKNGREDKNRGMPEAGETPGWPASSSSPKRWDLGSQTISPIGAGRLL